MDAKGLVSEAVAIRCSPPPARRRVPIQFDAWIVMSLSWYQFLLQCWDVALNLNENKCQNQLASDCHAFQFAKVWQIPGGEPLPRMPIAAWQAGSLLQNIINIPALQLNLLEIMPQSILPMALSSLLRATRQDVPWQMEANYIVPSAEKDGIPHASEGMRTHSGTLYPIPKIKYHQ